MTLFRTFSLAVRLAVRDRRGGVRALGLLVAGLFIGVAAVAVVGAMSRGLIDGARQGAIESVGGDISLRLFHRAPSDAELAVIRREGTVSLSTEVRPMARAVEGNAAVLVELKGVDGAYPLFGRVAIAPDRDLHEILARRDGVYGAVADPALLAALGLRLGDRVSVGTGRYQIRATLQGEPDRAFRAFSLGPRLMVARESLPATGVADAGSSSYHYARVKLPAASAALAAAALARVEAAFPQSGWRLVNAHDGVPGVQRTLGMAHALLLFIGLGVMLVGGAGIKGAVSAHISEKTKTIAILKSIGAPPNVIVGAFAVQVLATAAVGAVAGVAVGAAAPALAASVLNDHLPFALGAIPAAAPLISAGLFGLLVAALFSWWPLMAVRGVTAQALFNDQIVPVRHRLGLKGGIVAGGIAAALLALVLWTSPLPVVTVAGLAGALVLVAFYIALGRGIVRLAKALAKGRRAAWRLPLSNLSRTGAPTAPVVMALGLALTLLVALDGIGTAASRHVQKTLPAEAPDLVAFSLEPQTAARLSDALAGSGLVERHRAEPFLHARLHAIGGVPVRDLSIPRPQQWVIRGDRGVTFSATLPGGAVWPDGRADRPGFSVEKSVADKLGIALGETLTVNVSGDVRRASVVAYHDVDWNGLDLDFPLIATPATFAGIPYTLAASLKAVPGRALALESFIKARFPDVALIRVADVVQSLSTALGAIVAGLKAAVLLCGAAALVVLAGSVLQGMRERLAESVLFKVLGARRSQVLGWMAAEFLTLGTLVALAAVPLGTLVAAAVIRAAGLDDKDMSWTGGLTLAAVAIAVTVAVGVIVSLRAYTAKPARILRGRAL